MNPDGVPKSKVVRVNSSQGIVRQKATYVGRFRSYDSRMCVVLSKRALKDLSIYCTFHYFSFYLLIKLFTLPELIALVNKDL